VGLPANRGSKLWQPILWANNSDFTPTPMVSRPVYSVHYRPSPVLLPERQMSTSAMSKKKIYKILFMSQGQVYEIYARHVGHGTLFGFVEVEKLVFGARSSVVVDPSEEKIKSEFEGVTRTYLPMHSILRIDEVEKEGAGKISKIEGNITQFPVPVYSPNTPSSK
jgi:hypothetical protein